MKWIEWARKLQAISQTGLHYATDQFDQERYRRIGVISSEILASHTNLSVDDFLQLNAAEFGYATPKVDVRGVIFKDAKILLVREIADNGRWTLPGGWADVNQTPSESVIREVFEESGFQTRVVKLLAVYDREKQQHPPAFPYHIYKLFFHCEIIGGEAKVSIETSEIAWFGEDEIPELSESRVKKSQISRFFEYYQQPNLPTDFD
ncbi:MAG: NUDIX hydrolase [Xenococcaceae cyanobacterium MO_207.B15]|nr:NUDIX hydrolase [Xenococcaceae cyanobacterium MO_207.B15]MDJ0744121.1 NUDIX hydrolase [Xenococcaceae cyanobacterium MO_167.B27]